MRMALVIDIIILLIMILCIFCGYKKGLIGVAVSILGFFIALIIAFILYKPISNFVINNTEIKPTLQNAISDTVASYIIGNEEIQEDEEINNNSSQVINDYIDEFIKKEKQKIETTEREIINNVSETVAINIIRIGVGIIVFLMAKIALLFIQVLAKIIAKIPIIEQFDKLGGIIYGVLQGLIIIYIILALISLIAPTMENSVILESINSSYIGKLMYNNNLILKIILK